MTFKRGLVTMVAGLIAVIVATAASSIVALRLVLRTYQHANELTDELSLVQDARFDAERLVSASRRFLLVGNERAKQNLDASESHFDRTMRTLRHEGTRASTGLATVSAAAERYLDAIHAAAHARITSGDPAAIVDVFEDELLPLRREFENAANAYVHERREDAAATGERARYIATVDQYALVALLLAGLATAVGLAFLVARKLLRQFDQIASATETARRAVARRDEVLAIVSHDLRTPLTTVALGSALLEESVTDSQLRRTVSSISTGAERMRHLIDELLAREQLESGSIVLEPQRLDVDELIGTVIDLHEHRARAQHIELHTNVSAGEISADRERLIQVLSNLIGNALKYCPAGTVITVAARAETNATRFEVSDTGPGIAPHELPRLFDRYFQGTQPHERGSLGLGLFICKRIVDAHAGTIGVDSELGRGTTFWFTVPHA